jgi:MFS family permease
MTLSAWSPLQRSLFRALWIAAIASNIGTWMQNVGGVWLMTSLTPSPLMVALMQTATSLPVFLIGLPAGALADIIDRRCLLLFWQGWMLVAAAVLGGMTLLGIVSPWLLLTLTFVLGLGAAMSAPAWQAIIPELVPRPELPAAVALNGAGFNIARAVGPALGGLVVAAAGAAAVFLLNALSFLGIMLVLYHWHRPQRRSALPTERLVGAMRAGVRYVSHAPALQAVLVRTAVFISCSSALWALLPLVARQELKLGAEGYGALLGCLGAGAVIGAAYLPRVRQRVSVDRLLIIATVVFAIATLALAYMHNLVVLGIALMAGGFAWLATMSSLNIAAQTTVPGWVQARSLGVYQLVFQGGLAIGSAIWGLVAQHSGNAIALSGAAIGLILGLVVAKRYRLAAGEKLDLATSHHWAEPVVMVELRPEAGPVLVTVEYHIDPKQSQDFVQVMHELSDSRKRDGAIRWGLFYDTADPNRFVETFIVESWAEHLRQHERATVADRLAEEGVRAFLSSDKPPIVSHLIYARDADSNGTI